MDPIDTATSVITVIGIVALLLACIGVAALSVNVKRERDEMRADRMRREGR